GGNGTVGFGGNGGAGFGGNSTVGFGGAGTGDPCSSGADCSQCPDPNSCFQCYTMDHQAGLQDYQNLVNCILCDACPTTCSQFGNPGTCPDPPPPPPDMCDVGGAGMQQCNN